jgi:hypothetical protein
MKIEYRDFLKYVLLFTFVNTEKRNYATYRYFIQNLQSHCGHSMCRRSEKVHFGSILIP